jgi:peptidoglycan/LPS O-acetylase OafA/YrhL
VQDHRSRWPPYHAAIADPTPALLAAERTARFPTFEGLRALCALAVLVYHAGTFTGLTWGPGAVDEPLGPWVQHLNVGVSVFFVLSGFLLFRPFVLADLAGDRAPAAVPYLVRRLVRIFPAYWVALFVSTQVLDLELGDWWGHVRFYGLLQIYWGDTVLGGLVQAWSLCTELSFYLFLPLWAAGLRRVGGRRPADRVRVHAAGLVALYVLGLATRTWLRAGDHAIGYATLPANADLFAIGMALALVRSAAAVADRPPGGLARTLGEAPGAAWLAAGCCYLGAVSLGYPFGLVAPTVSQEVLRQVLFGAIAGLVVAPGAFGDQARGAIRRLLRSKPLWALGVVSYGIYLWHLTAMERLVEIGRWVGDPSMLPLVALTTVITVAIAAASWWGLERPLLARARRAVPGRAPSKVVP